MMSSRVPFSTSRMSLKVSFAIVPEVKKEKKLEDVGLRYSLILQRTVFKEV